MNINELNRIKTVNIEEAVAGVERGSGTFKEILDNVMSEVIIPLVDNAGRIIGMNFDTKVENLIQDSIEQRKFEIRYCCKPIMAWVMKSLQLKADGKVIAEVIENEEGIKVVTNTGEIIDIETYYIPNTNNPAVERVQLPSELKIPYDDCDAEDEDEVIAYLRNTYDHYLSGKHEKPIVEFDDDEEVIKVTNIYWGRKR